MPQNATYESLMNEISKLVELVKNVKVNGAAENEVKKVVHTRRKPLPKYKDPVSGQTWTGRGKIPVWMKEPIAKGISKENFALNS